MGAVKPMHEQRKDLVFVVSGGRTGTQFFGHRMSMAIHDSFSVHDPDVLSVYLYEVAQRLRVFGLWNMTLGKAFGHTGIRSIGHRLITGRIDLQTAISRLRKAREDYYRSISSPLIIESNSQWLYVCNQLPLIWPNARVIVIIRDPRTWIRSWLNKGVRWRPYDPVRILPPGRLTPEKVGDRYWAQHWNSFDTFGRLAWEWKFVYGRLLEHVENNVNARLFRFEDLFNSRHSHAMNELLNFASIHPDRQYKVEAPKDFPRNIKNASSGSALEWRSWPAEQARLVDALCGPLMAKFGYGCEDEWVKKIQVTS